MCIAAIYIAAIYRAYRSQGNGPQRGCPICCRICTSAGAQQLIREVPSAPRAELPAPQLLKRCQHLCNCIACNIHPHDAPTLLKMPQHPHHPSVETGWRGRGIGTGMGNIGIGIPPLGGERAEAEAEARLSLECGRDCGGASARTGARRIRSYLSHQGRMWRRCRPSPPCSHRGRASPSLWQTHALRSSPVRLRMKVRGGGEGER